MRITLVSLLACGTMAATAGAADLSRYRHFQLGASLQAIARQVNATPSDAKAIHSRPALIQDLEWRPQPPGSPEMESAHDVVFRFYNGELFQIAVNYDRYKTAGLTADDFVEGISTAYGIAERPAVPAVKGRYDDDEQLVARWQDSQYTFDLIRSSHGPAFKLVGLLKKLQGPAQLAIAEATRLDEREAPQREAARTASEAGAANAELEKARLVNKPRFRP